MKNNILTPTNKPLVTIKTFRLNAFLSLIKIMIEMDTEVREHVELSKITEEYDFLFDDDDQNEYIKQEKIKLYSNLSKRGFGRNMINNMKISLPIVEKYFNSFKKDYERFVKERNNIHLPILFATYGINYLIKQNILTVDKEIFDTVKINGMLNFKSKIDKKERNDYRDLILLMWKNIKKITNKTNKKRRRK